MRKVLILILLVVSPWLWGNNSAYAQIGGKHSFDFALMPSNARVAGLGNINVSVIDSDPSMLTANPATLQDTMLNNLAFTYQPLIADISAVSSFVATKIKGQPVAAGVYYLNYGSIDGYDAAGNSLGTSFPVAEYMFMATTSFSSGPFRLGGNLKFLRSDMAGYGASALAVDMGGMFIHPERDFTIGLTINNLGFGLSRYQDMPIEMPIDVRAGFSYKLEHMPLRFNLTLHNLHRWDVAYDPPNTNNNNGFGSTQTDDVSFTDNVLRHTVFGLEFILAKGLHLRAGYNHLIRQELRLENASGGAGLSLGAMLQIRSFKLSYSRAFYHVAGFNNYLTIAIDADQLLGRNQLTGGAQAQ